jgi:hypothetical protein
MADPRRIVVAADGRSAASQGQQRQPEEAALIAMLVVTTTDGSVQYCNRMCGRADGRERLGHRDVEGKHFGGGNYNECSPVARSPDSASRFHETKACHPDRDD